MSSSLPAFTARQLPSDSVLVKACRLAQHGKVTRQHGRAFTVQGDTGTYTTVLTRNTRWGTGRFHLEGVCSCPAAGPCSHLLACGFAEHANRKAKQ